MHVSQALCMNSISWWTRAARQVQVASLVSGNELVDGRDTALLDCKPAALFLLVSLLRLCRVESLGKIRLRSAE
jgi:hypothetical protein